MSRGDQSAGSTLKTVPDALGSSDTSSPLSIEPTTLHDREAPGTRLAGPPPIENSSGPLAVDKATSVPSGDTAHREESTDSPSGVIGVAAVPSTSSTYRRARCWLDRALTTTRRLSGNHLSVEKRQSSPLEMPRRANPGGDEVEVRPKWS